MRTERHDCVELMLRDVNAVLSEYAHDLFVPQVPAVHQIDLADIPQNESYPLLNVSPPFVPEIVPDII